MPKESWKTSENDVEMARIGVMTQAAVHKLDLTNPDIVAFLELTINVQAAMGAESRWLRRIIDDMSARINKVTPES